MSVRFSKFLQLVLFAFCLLAWLVFFSPAVGAAGKKVAVVIGISEFQDPRLVELARPEFQAGANEVAEVLKKADFDVHLFAGQEATVESLTRFFTETLGLLVGEGDTLVICVSVLANGGDFEEPRLFVWDSNPDDLENTSVSFSLLADTLVPFRNISLMVVTNTNHQGTLNTFVLRGPSFDFWSKRLPEALVIEVGLIGTEWPEFGTVFSRGLNGLADSSQDGQLTFGELSVYFKDQSGEHIPVFVSGKYDFETVLVRRSAPVVSANSPGQARRRTVGKISFATAALAAGGGLGFYLDGRNQASWYFNGQSPPRNSATAEARYNRDRFMSGGLAVVSVIGVVGGGTFFLLPEPDKVGAVLTFGF